MTFPIHVISLPRTPERRARFAAWNPDLPFQWFDAVDGETVDRAPFAGVPYTPGAAGCALSHLALWDLAPVTVVEDDVVLRADFVSASTAIIKQLPADWDFIAWGCNLDGSLSLALMPDVTPAVVTFSQDQARGRLAAFHRSAGAVHALPLDRCFGTPAYSISRRGAEAFRAGCWPPVPTSVLFPGVDHRVPNNGIDIAMSRIYRATRSYVALPFLAVTPNLHAESLTLERADAVA